MTIAIQSTFSKGEISPALYGRVDTAIYQTALRKAKNMIVHIQGGASRRPGTEFIGPVKTHTESPRLVPFEFKNTDSYMLEFGNLYMRVIRNGAHVVESAVTITGATAANPVVVTATSHGYSDGDEVFIDSVAGMTEINNQRFVVANKAANTFELTHQVTGSNIDGTAFTAYTSGGTSARIYEIATPYVLADLDKLKSVQSADIMTLTHTSYTVRELTRTDHDAWTITEPTFAPGIDDPTGLQVTVNTAGAETERYIVTTIADETFEESIAGVNNISRTITAATAANPVVITSASHLFTDGDEVEIAGIVGMTEINDRRFTVANQAANTFELQGEDGTSHTAYTSGGTANQTFVRITTSAATKDNTITWTAVTDAQKYAVYIEENGLFGLIGETELTTFTDSNIAADLTIGPPKARNPFRLANNYPGTASYYEQRRVFGSTNNKPDTAWYSRTGAQSNFSTSIPTQADDAITATLNARQVNEIRHFVPSRDFVILTSGSEWFVNSGDNSGFAADTIKQKPQTFWGSSHLSPLVIGNTILYVQESETIVRSLGYSLQLDGYTGTELSLLSKHLFKAHTIVSWSHITAPESRVYCVLNDGHGATMTFDQEQEVIAWTDWDTLGKFEEVEVIDHEDGEVENQVFLIVKRTIDGNTVRYVERQMPHIFGDVEDAVFVDCSLSFDNPVTITGATAADPVVITATAHGFSDGDEVDIVDIEWTTTFDAVSNEIIPSQLNGFRYTVANKTANTFELTDEDGNNIDGSAFAAYIEGGVVRRASSSLTGFRHLANEPVSVLSDGNVISTLTVGADGSLTLPRKASRVHVGLKYISDLETLNPESPQGTIQGKRMKIPAVTVRFEKSRGLLIGPDSDNLIEMKQREFELMGQPTALLTGDKKIELTSGWSTNGRIFLRQKDPLPMHILAVIPDILVGDDDE